MSYASVPLLVHLQVIMIWMMERMVGEPIIFSRITSWIVQALGSTSTESSLPGKGLCQLKTLNYFDTPTPDNLVEPQ